MAEISCNQVSPAKKEKIIDESSGNNASIHENLPDLSDFKSEAILTNNTRSKSICLKGTFSGKDGVGIVLLEKTAFTENDLTDGKNYLSPDCYLKKDFSNDIYGNYQFFPKAELNGKFICDITLQS